MKITCEGILTYKIFLDQGKCSLHPHPWSQECRRPLGDTLFTQNTHALFNRVEFIAQLNVKRWILSKYSLANQT